MISIRRAGALDAGQMSELLNQIIQIGGTTAYTSAISRQDLAAKMARNADRSAWHLAEDDAGHLLGFQWIAPYPPLPDTAADIATFVRVGKTGLGTGSRLFQASTAAARALGYTWINATIRADNAGGLVYYQSRGFEDYHRQKDVLLANGQRVDKISKRYDL